MTQGLINVFTPTKSDITKNAEHKSYVEYSETNVRKFTFSVPAWDALLLTTESAPDIHKFKHPLDRDQNLLVNKFDCDSFSVRKIIACSSRPNQTQS